MSETLTIGEVARRAGVRSSAIRYYESVQVLPAPERINGRRRYDASVLRRLAVIQLAQEAGFSMSQIRLLFNNPEGDAALAARWQTYTHQKLANVDALIAQAQNMKKLLEDGLRCGCLNLDDCMDCLLNQVSGVRQVAGELDAPPRRRVNSRLEAAPPSLPAEAPRPQQAQR